MKWAKQTQRGFTIVELLIVVVVIAILAAITIVAYNGIQNRAKASAAQSSASSAAKKVATYAITNNDIYPDTLSTAGVIDSGGTTFQYTVDNSSTPKDYCVTAKNGTATYYAGAASPARQGSCFDSYQLKGWWQLNGNANDSSGLNNNGTVVNAVSVNGRGGEANGAYTFANNGDQIAIPANASLVNQVFTYTAWVKASGGTVIGGAYGSPQFRIDSGKLVLLKLGNYQFPASTGSVASNAWTYVGVTYDAAGNYLYYINGAPAGGGTNLQTFSFGQVALGSSAVAETLNGPLEGVRIFGRVLSAAEMLTLYNSNPQ